MMLFYDLFQHQNKNVLMFVRDVEHTNTHYTLLQTFLLDIEVNRMKVESSRMKQVMS